MKLSDKGQFADYWAELVKDAPRIKKGGQS